MTTIVHREFIRDIVSSSSVGAFEVQSFVVNPGSTNTFPWLSVISQNFEQYYIHGLQFFFRSGAGDNSTTGQQGNVILAAEYNVNSPPYFNKQVMENSAGARSVKQSNSVEFNLKSVNRTLFTRSGQIPAGDSLKFYDHAIFQIATVGFPTASFNAGELWVAYKISFIKPQIPANFGGVIQSGLISRSGASSANLLGSATVIAPIGPIAISVPSLNNVRFDNLSIGNSYTIMIHYNGTAALIAALSVGALSGFVGKNLFNAKTTTNANGGTGGTSGNYTYETCFTATSTTGTISFNGGTPPSAAIVDILVRSIDNTLVA
ncbi:capsid protein [Crucivirus-204]|nr:capsid protein [Crucivirus-204]